MRRLTVLMTGASGFIGRAITRRLIDRADVRGLTSHPARDTFGDRVRTDRYDFERPERMADAFSGVDVFINSFYVRFDHGAWTFDRAVNFSAELLALARSAAVGTIVQVSVSNADERSDLPYYRNKARIERLVRESVCHIRFCVRR